MFILYLYFLYLITQLLALLIVSTYIQQRKYLHGITQLLMYYNLVISQILSSRF
jgi:hypothetical protein